MQMCYYFLKRTRLVSLIDLTELDIISMLIASVCHDLGHDGYTNGYHVNTISRRAIDCNDISAQESFHASELFRLLSKPECQFMDQMSRQEYMHFRKRVVSMILATDMAHHNEKVSTMKQVLLHHEFKDKDAVMEWITDGQEPDSEDYNIKKFKNQQVIMDLLVHAADISQQCRTFEVARVWTYLLFVEFFDQGDLEK